MNSNTPLNFNWKLNQLMRQRQVTSAEQLVEQIRLRYPEAKGTLGVSTVKAILSGTANNIHQDALIALCRFFRLKSLAQLVDFTDAPDPGEEFWERSPQMRVKYGLRALMDQKGIPQSQLAEASKYSHSTVNRFYLGKGEKISFDVIITFAVCLRKMIKQPHPNLDKKVLAGHPLSIVELIEIESIGRSQAGTQTGIHPALEKLKQRKAAAEKYQIDARTSTSSLSVETRRDIYIEQSSPEQSSPILEEPSVAIEQPESTPQPQHPLSSKTKKSKLSQGYDL
jgi:transcriptional regulator with XRE-family HTH domain